MSLFTRKMYRSMLKRLFRYAYIPNETEMAHRFEGLRIAPEPTLFSDTFDIFYKNELLGRSHSQTELEKGMDELFLIGSGPSVNYIDHTQLIGKKCIYTNAAVLLSEKIQTPPYFVVTTDSYRYVVFRDVMKMMPPGTNLLLSFQALKEMAHYDIERIKNNHIFINHFKPETLYLCNTDPEKAVEIFDRHDYGRMDGGTVMAEAIRLAAYLKAKKTYIIGFDFNTVDNTTYFYSPGNKPRANNGVLIATDNYISQKVMPFVKVASIYFKRNNQEIYNCSRTTIIPYDFFPYSDRLEG